MAKLLANPAPLPDARIRLIAQRASMEAAARSAGVALDLPALPWAQAADARVPIARLEWDGWDAPAFAPAKATAANGAFMLESLRRALDLAQRGDVDAVCFAPLNKAALRAGGMAQEDELRWFADILQHRGPCGEFNVLEQLWTSRVTSHVPLKDVAGLLTVAGVAEAIGMLHDALRRAGTPAPRIGVCGLNPHNGDNGNFGREETRRHRSRNRAGRDPRACRQRSLFRRHDLRAREKRCVRRHRYHVPRPGSDRDEVDGLRTRRHRPGRPAGGDHDPRARHGV